MSANKSKTAAAPEPLSAEQVERDVTRRLEAISFGTLPKLALLARWSQAESLADRGGVNIRLEHMAWRGVEMLCIDVLRDLEGLLRAADAGSDYATLPDDDDEGCAR